MNIKVTNNNKLPTESNLNKNLHTLILFDEKHSNPLFATALTANIKRQVVKITDIKKNSFISRIR